MFFRPKVSTLVQELKDLDREEGANVETVRHALAKLEELCLQRAHALSTIDEDGLPALSKSLFSEDMTVRQAAAGFSDRARRLPPVSAFGRGAGARFSWTSRSGIGLG